MGLAVFAFDLAVLGIVVSTQAVRASQEIEAVCDATHVNNQVDVHAAFDGKRAHYQIFRAGSKSLLLDLAEPGRCFSSS